MRVAIAATVVAFSASVFAGPVAVWKGENVKVLAYPDDCDVPHLAMVLAQFGGQAKKASVQLPGREFAACYVVQEGRVIIVDTEGNGGYIDASEFKENLGV